MIKQIADAKTNRDAWLEARRGYLTSSDFYTWLGDTPKWWSDTRHEIIRAKRDGSQKEFPPDVQVSVEHGSFDEEQVIRKFAYETGSECEAINSLTVNDRWPRLAASIDGLVHHCFPPDGKFCFSQDTERMRNVANGLEHFCQDGPVLLEIKKSTSAGWSNGKVSEWYIPQIQGQMHILDLERCVIVADTVLRRGPRLFWNLVAIGVTRDPDFAAVLDKMNEEFDKAVPVG